MSFSASALALFVAELFDAVLVATWPLTDVDGSAAASVAFLGARRWLAGRRGPVAGSAALVSAESVVAAADCSGDVARGVTAGPGVGGADTSERSESPSNTSMVRDKLVGTS